jgi:ABC-type multidrug transport system ATPase subunit
VSDVIAFHAFTKQYGLHRAVDALTLNVRPGEVVGLLGPNGSGKTTSLKAAAGLITPTSGAVLIGENARTSMDPDARRACSFLPQRVSFPEALTGREVVDFYRALRGVSGSQADAALRLAALNGASTRPVSTYSGGMVQRLGLAVAVVADAPILLLDEPTAALDPAGLEAFHELIERLKREGRAVLFTSHQLGDVEQLADRFAVLVEGRLVAVLTREELAQRIPDRRTMRLHAFYRQLTGGDACLAH